MDNFKKGIYNGDNALDTKIAYLLFCLGEYMDNNHDMIDNNIEEEVLTDIDTDQMIEPFDPKDVDIISQTMVISNIMDRLAYGEIILDPDFQRLPNLWGDVQQSRLIESLIIKIPLPSFYFDCDDDDDKLTVVDGLQRLIAIKRFAVLKKDDPNKLKLTGLEYLKEYDGSYFEDLPISIRRRIKEQTITAYIIRSGTPEKVRTSIFTRINTGGLTLQPAEIKNSVYRGQAANFLKELAHLEEFKQATRHKINPSRMLDCEFVNRFLAFFVLGIENYKGNLEDYLNDAMIALQKSSPEELSIYRSRFVQAMKYAHLIFQETAFRKLNKDGNYGKINKPLYDTISVNLGKLTETECDTLLRKRNQLLNDYHELLNNDDFVDIITNGTAKIPNVKLRYRLISKLFRGILDHD